ncbi:hypothetical protein ACLI09_00065 [Flavobacterium sp. RHBU_24]|uniref:hypothetical protein n=1 Tax=Flavobacterium sp. RHBU_24 TaxID=3391185 RepID=UPI003985583E
MKQQYLSIFFKTGIIAITACVLNILYFVFFPVPDVIYHYSLYFIYGFFTLSSFLILGILIFVNRKSAAQTGYAFLLLTAVKMGVSYAIARPLLTKTIEFPTEKLNFFIVFTLFLAIEAYFTARLLNNKQ